ncbi:hypothetical protein ARMSODRAFT_953697 [Armillaria solidipes]|uniref:MYND-type domain-containing protein n=1 Tax=Armillaria solidipes TaxID=1076256 RepID=A0A2H3BW49_9AGAR|nr:hypothetical protein ARMSODRAFT_953697 [Armillaria solidipes]
MKKLIKSAKDGSYEAMMALGLKASRNRLACQDFFCVMEENLKFDTASIQDMKRGRLPLVPSLDPKDVLNTSCNSMLVLATSLRDQFLFQPMCLVDWTSSVVALMPAISFWLCLFCEHIILPSRTSEFTFIDFHRAVVFILAWTIRQNKIMMESTRKLFTDYLPFLWFHPPPGCTKYDLDDARALFAAIDHWLIAADKPQRDLFVSRLEENATLTASLVVQFIVDEFAHIPEESDMTFLYQSFLAVTSSTFHFACESPHIHTALLKNNILKWTCLAFRFVTRRVRFTYVTLGLATRCVSIGLVYIFRVIQDGHSYIHQLLGYDLLLYMMKALQNLHDHPDLTEQEYKTSMEDHTVAIIHGVISHLVYASILKRSKKAISKIQRQHVDGFLNSEDPGLKQVCKAWTKFINIASYRSDICSIPDSLCGSRQCPGTSVGKSMACSGCQFTRYCSRTCQKDDWSSGAHRSLCIKIKQLRTDGAPLPVCLSDKRACEGLDSHYIELHRQEPSELDVLLKIYIAENGKPDPFWPMLWVLDYRAVDVKPHFRIESSELHAEGLNPEMLAKARDGTATLIYCIIPDGQHALTGLYMKQWVED